MIRKRAATATKTMATKAKNEADCEEATTRVAKRPHVEDSEDELKGQEPVEDVEDNTMDIF